jgi:hypothetical protein
MKNDFSTDDREALHRMIDEITNLPAYDEHGRYLPLLREKENEKEEV